MPSDKPIFISYAPEDAAAAQRVAEALRESGIEARVNDTPGADLKAEIENSTLFLAIISQNAEAHASGNFRNEWEIAAAHMETLPRGVPFLLPIIIDDTEEYGATSPDAFGGVHWIRQPDGETSPDLIEEVVRLLTIPRGPVYFPPIPPGLSRPPFSMKKKKSPVLEKVVAKPWIKPAIIGGAGLILAMLVFLMFSNPRPAEVQPTAPEDYPETNEAATANQATPTAPEVAVEPAPLTDEQLFAAVQSGRRQHDYAGAAARLAELLARQPSPSYTQQRELAWLEFARDLDPDAYLERVAQITSPGESSEENWLPPAAYGLKRDFANQRRAIRAGAGSLAVDFVADADRPEIALTESYMDQGNWALARHYGNQARAALQDIMSPAAVGPLVNGQYEAFLLMTRKDPAAIAQLEQLSADFEEGRETTQLLLIRALIDQGQNDQAIDLIHQTLAEPSSLDPARVLFLPPFEKLHAHPAFKPMMETYVPNERIDAAIAWVQARLSGAQSSAPIY